MKTIKLNTQFILSKKAFEKLNHKISILKQNAAVMLKINMV